MKAYIRIEFKQPVNREAVDLGALRICHTSGRQYILDITQSWTEDDYSITACATEDFESFVRDIDDNPYDLTMDDIASGELGATLFVGTEDDNEVESITYDLTDNMSNVHATDLTAVAE